MLGLSVGTGALKVSTNRTYFPHTLAMNTSLAPGFLMAMPDLMDPNFFRSVVLLCSHTEEGAFGLVLNQPAGASMKSVCEGAEIDWEGSDARHAYLGGPVEPTHGWVIHDSVQRFEDTQDIAPGLAISTSQEALRAYGRDPEGDYRLCLGYAGWGAGQLDEELATGSWLTTKVCTKVAFRTEAAGLWRAAIALVGIDPVNLVSGNQRVN